MTDFSEDRVDECAAEDVLSEEELAQAAGGASAISAQGDHCPVCGMRGRRVTASKTAGRTTRVASSKTVYQCPKCRITWDPNKKAKLDV